MKCPQCREVTKAESLNSLRKNFPLLDLLKLHRASVKFLTEHIKTHRLNSYKPLKKLPVTNLNKTDELAQSLMQSKCDSEASAAMTIADLGDTWEPKLQKAA